MKKVVFVCFCFIFFVRTQPIVGDCLNVYGEESEIILLKGEYDNYENGQIACEAIDANLIIIESEEYSIAATEQIEKLKSGYNNFYLGMKREALVSSFEFSDGQGGDKSFFLSSSSLPWLSLPNDPTLNCVLWNFSSSALPRWTSVSCETDAKALCRRPCSESESNLTKSECFYNSYEIVLVGSEDFDSSVVECEKLGGFVARIESLDDFRHTQQFLSGHLKESGEESGSFYVGLKRVVENENERVEDVDLLFSFVDGKEKETFYFQNKGEFPWMETNEPGSNTLSEQCVENFVGSTQSGLFNRHWKSTSCTSNKQTICKRDYCTQKSELTDEDNIPSEPNEEDRESESSGVMLGWYVLIFLFLVGVVLIAFKFKDNLVGSVGSRREREESL